MTHRPGRPGLKLWLLSVLLGTIAALGLAPLGWWWASLIALALQGALFLRTDGAGRAAWVGWGFGLGYFALGMMWIVEPFLVDIRTHGWMAPFGLLFMAGGLALFWAAAFWCAQRVVRGRGTRVIALVLFWTLAEYGRAYLLTGFPWAGLAQIWVDSPAALLLAWVGPHGLALWTLAATVPLALGVRQLALSVPGVTLAVSAFWVGMTAPDPTMTDKTIRLIQPNAPQHLKWHPDHVWQFFESQLTLTANGDRPDLVVWPETSVPTVLSRSQTQLEAVAKAGRGAPVVLGIRRLEGRRAFNSLAVIGPSGEVLAGYDKHHLVPFGEYIPLGELAARFGIRGFAASQGEAFTSGPGPALLELPGIGPALPLICYEAVFPQDVNGAPGRAAVLLQITNDAWFGAWSGPYQHLAQARMRAIEQGLPMIRVANTGVSAMIDPWGRVVASLPLNTAGALDVPLPRPAAATVYAKTGDWPPFLLNVLLCVVLVLLQMRPRPHADD